MAKISTLVDAFTTLDLVTKWAFSYGTPTLSSGQVQLSCLNTYEGLYTGTTYDLVDSQIVAEMVSIPTGGGASRNTELVCEIDTNNRITMGFVGDQMYCRQRVAGTYTVWTSFAYNSTNHRWWKIQHTTAAGVTFWTSPNGTTWTQQGTAQATSLTLTAVYAHIFCGYYGTETSPPAAVVDNVNNAPSATSASAGHASASVTASQPAFPARALAGSVTAAAAPQVATKAKRAEQVSATFAAQSPLGRVGAQTSTVQPIIGMYGGYGSVDGIPKSDANEVLLQRPMEMATDYIPHDTWAQFNTTTLRTWQLDPWRTWRNSHPGSKFVYGIPVLTAEDVGDFAGVVAGTYDSYFTIAGNALVASGHPDAIIMLGWEPNNATIGAWQATTNPSGYIAAYQHIVTLLRGIGGSSFTFSLSSAIGPSGTIDAFDDYYPGSSYVDYLGMNIYDVKWMDTGVTAAQRWTHITTTAMGLNDHAAWAISKGKPLVCHEWGLYLPGDDYAGGGDNPYFITQMANYFRTANVYFQSYFYFDWGGGTLDDFPNGRAQYALEFSTIPMVSADAFDAQAVKTLVAQHPAITGTAYNASVPGNRSANPTPVSVLPFVVSDPSSAIRVNPRRIGF